MIAVTKPRAICTVPTEAVLALPSASGLVFRCSSAFSPMCWLCGTTCSRRRNTAMQHFGPTNVEVWTLAVGVNLGEGPRAYERAIPTESA